MTTVTTTDAPLPEGPWTLEQTTQAMIAVAIEAAGVWAEKVFLLLDHAGAVAQQGPAELRTWAGQVTDMACINLIEDADRLADELGATREQRSDFIAARVAVFQQRLDELVGAGLQRGSA